MKYIRIVSGGDGSRQRAPSPVDDCGDHVDQSILIEFIRIISGISYYASLSADVIVEVANYGQYGK